MPAFDDYTTARAHAEREAAKGRCMGIERSQMPGSPRVEWVVRGLPSPEKRFGVDARCEAVEPLTGPRSR